MVTYVLHVGGFSNLEERFNGKMLAVFAEKGVSPDDFDDDRTNPILVEAVEKFNDEDTGIFIEEVDDTKYDYAVTSEWDYYNDTNGIEELAKTPKVNYVKSLMETGDIDAMMQYIKEVSNN